jgi:hypothetical protein
VTICRVLSARSAQDTSHFPPTGCGVEEAVVIDDLLFSSGEQAVWVTMGVGKLRECTFDGPVGTTPLLANQYGQLHLSPLPDSPEGVFRQDTADCPDCVQLLRLTPPPPPVRICETSGVEDVRFCRYRFPATDLNSKATWFGIQ